MAFPGKRRSFQLLLKLPYGGECPLELLGLIMTGCIHLPDDSQVIKLQFGLEASFLPSLAKLCQVRKWIKYAAERSCSYWPRHKSVIALTEHRLANVFRTLILGEALEQPKVVSFLVYPKFDVCSFAILCLLRAWRAIRSSGIYRYRKTRLKCGFWIDSRSDRLQPIGEIERTWVNDGWDERQRALIELIATLSVLGQTA